MKQEVIDRVRNVANPILEDGEIELLDVQFQRESKGWVLRLILDKEGGITLDDCTRISQEVGRSLDIEDFIENPYTLEVSSPGLTRSLKTEKDFKKYYYRLIKVKTFEPVQNRRQFKGKLVGFSEDRIEIEEHEGILQIPLSNVAKANLEIDQDVFYRGTK